MNGLRSLLAGSAALILSGAAPSPPTRLFSSNELIRMTLRGPISAIAASAQSSLAARPAMLQLTHPSAESHAILLSPRGLTRRQREKCDFPPLRITFVARPPAASLFERQKRLKLVTHCQRAASFQRHVLLEYAAYRMLDTLTPASLRVRLASIDYAEANGRLLVSRAGFLIEDPEDSARRNGLREIRLVARIPPGRLDPAAAARAALFQYMIGNLDWSMRAGPMGDSCCHNFKLLGPEGTAAGAIVPVPYDFDSSGLVDAPYAVPPDSLAVSSVRQRRYRGYCMHNAQALAAAAEFRSKRPALLGVLSQVPGLDEGARRRAAAYLDGFFADIASDEQVTTRLLKTCIN